MFWTIIDPVRTFVYFRGGRFQVRKSALGRLLKPLFNLDDIEFQTDNLLTPLKEGSTEVCASIR